MAHSHHKSHGHAHHHDNKGNILLAFFLNAGFAIIELIGGYLTNSVAVYSDAIHDLGDSLSLLFSYFAEKIGRKNPDHKYTYGYRRLSVMAALINGLVLLGGSSYVVYEAILRIRNPEPVEASGMILLAVLGISVNGFAAYRLSLNSGLNSKMIFYHLLEDLLGWFAVFVVSIVLLFKPWYILDSILSILIAAIILRGVIVNMGNIVSILLQKFPEGLKREELIEEISKFQLVEGVHFVQGWSVDDSRFNLTLHIDVSPDTKIRELDILRNQIEDYLKTKNVIYTTIQFEGQKCTLSFS